jgi:hypothetical protein
MRLFQLEKTEGLLSRFWGKVEKLGNECGCWLWMASTLPRGYGKFGMTRKSGWKLAHRVSYFLHFGAFEDDRMVLHKCDSPWCVRPDHLFLGDHTANMEDQRLKGRVPIGQQRYNSKLTDDKVRKMRRERVNGKNFRELAEEAGISTHHARAVVHKRRWGYLE